MRSRRVLRHTEAAHGAFLGESCGDVRQSLAQRAGVNAGARDGFPCDLIRTGADFLGVAHRSLERVLEGFGLCRGLVDEGLQLPQLADLVGAITGSSDKDLEDALTPEPAEPTAEP